MRQAAGEILTTGMERSAYKMKDAADRYVASPYIRADAISGSHRRHQ